jgi:penicillin-binding protein 2
LAESCDVFYYEIAQKVGIDKIAEMGKRFGMGVRHDLPMSAITEGIMPNKAWKQERWGQEWRIGDTINASIGQGYVLASPLQLTVMTARIASGRAVEPRILRAIGGKPVDMPPAEPLGIDATSLRSIRDGMHEVMNSQRGTAFSSRIADETMVLAGKTGTSQVRNITAAERARGVVSNDDLPWDRRDHALYVGYAPFDKPRYAVTVVVEHGGGGSAAAAPIARDAILRALYGDIPPLAAYPQNQRGRIETDLENLRQRLRDSDATGNSRA